MERWRWRQGVRGSSKFRRRWRFPQIRQNLGKKTARWSGPWRKWQMRRKVLVHKSVLATSKARRWCSSAFFRQLWRSPRELHADANRRSWHALYAPACLMVSFGAAVRYSTDMALMMPCVRVKPDARIPSASRFSSRWSQGKKPKNAAKHNAKRHSPLPRLPLRS